MDVCQLPTCRIHLIYVGLYKCVNNVNSLLSVYDRGEPEIV